VVYIAQQARRSQHLVGENVADVWIKKKNDKEPTSPGGFWTGLRLYVDPDRGPENGPTTKYHIRFAKTFPQTISQLLIGRAAAGIGICLARCSTFQKWTEMYVSRKVSG